MVRRAACGPPDFPTCGFGDATAPDQNDVVHAQIVKLGDGGADDRRKIVRQAIGRSSDRGDDDQRLAPSTVNGERRAVGWLERGVTVPDGQFDVLGVVVPTVDDDQILEAPRHEQLPIEQESEVSSAKKRPVRDARKVGIKRVLRFGRLVPVSFRDAWARHPYLTDPARRAGRSRVGIDDQGRCAWTPTRSQGTHVNTAGRRWRRTGRRRAAPGPRRDGPFPRSAPHRRCRSSGTARGRWRRAAWTRQDRSMV